MGYKVHTVDNRSGDIDLAHVRTRTFTFQAAAAGRTPIRIPYACTVTAVRGYRNGGSAATVQAIKNSSDILAAPLSISSADTWISETDAADLANKNLAAGDTLHLQIAAVTGVTYATVQVDVVIDVPAAAAPTA